MSKKLFLRFAMLGICLLLLSSAFFGPSFDIQLSPVESETVFYEPKDGEIVGYYLSKNDFEQFLEKPTMEILLKRYDHFWVYRKAEEREGYIQLLDDTGNLKGEKASGYYRMGAWPVYTEFIDFINNSQNLERILKDNTDSTQTLLNYIILQYSWYEPQEGVYIPPGTGPQMCIWLHTKEGDYFLENDVYHGDPFSTDFDYVFYGLKQYQAIFKQRSSTGY